MPHSANDRSEITVEAAVSAYKQFGSARKAATALGCSREVIHRRLRQNIPAGVMPPPDGQIISGVSTLYGPDGDVKAQWVKTRTELQDQLKATIDAVREAFEDTPKVNTIQAPKACNSRLLTVYPIGDMHCGDLAWPEEVGNDYNLKIADKLLTSAAAHLVSVAPASEYAIIANVGDFLHVDNLRNQTSRSANTLDMDTRYAAMIRAAIKMLRATVEAALAKHKHVKLINATGNHDDIGSMWLQQAFSMLYEQNPRVTIETKAGKFHYHEHGKVLIGVTHGDTGKPERLHGVMAADMPEAWGRTRHRFWYTGHVHTKSVMEFPGVTWETFRTLAPNNAWAHGAGFRSGRDMNAIVLDSQFGEVGRHRFDVSMLQT